MNNWTGLGRFIKNPELRFLAGSGTAVANFTIACNKNLSREKKAEFEAQGKPTADFIRCKVFGKRAETIANYFSKGSEILVTGSIDTGSYTKEDGTKVYTTDVLVNNFEFTGGSKKKDDDFSMGGMDTSDFAAIDDSDLDSQIPF